jgi:hypothetical protein
MDENKNSNEKEEVPFIANSDKKKPLKFGWGKFRPDCLQIFNGPNCFLFVVVLFTVCQGKDECLIAFLLCWDVGHWACTPVTSLRSSRFILL